MPFDQLDYQVESETRRNLRELSRLLRHPEEWPKWEWDFGTFLHGCGSAGCALGLWDAAKGAALAYLDDIAGGMEEDSFHEIFLGAAAYDVQEMSAVTPQMVADKIDAYLRDNPEV